MESSRPIFFGRSALTSYDYITMYLFSSGVAEELPAGGVAVRVDPCQRRAGHLPHNHQCVQ